MQEQNRFQFCQIVLLTLVGSYQTSRKRKNMRIDGMLTFCREINFVRERFISAHNSWEGWQSYMLYPHLTLKILFFFFFRSSHTVSGHEAMHLAKRLNEELANQAAQQGVRNFRINRSTSPEPEPRSRSYDHKSPQKSKGECFNYPSRF